MSRIDDLIAELCPEGVEFVELGKLLAYEQPTKYLVDSTAYSDSYATPVLTAGQTFVLGRTDETNGIYPASTATPVIIFDDFTTAFKWVDFPFKAKSSAMKMLTPKEAGRASLRYIYYVMQTIRYEPQDHARQWIGIYSGFQVPVPPLEVQREIVRVLDQFTQLEAELEAELEARRRQYEHYRTKVFDFSADIDVRWSTLGEISTRVSSGATPKAGAPEYYDGGTIPWLRTGEVTFGEIWDTEMKITDRALKETGASWIKENCVIVAISGATAARSAINKIPLTTNQHCCNLQIDDTQANYRYVFFWVSSKYEELKAFGRGARSDLNAKLIKDFPIPVPSLDEQRRIVSLLDKFDALVNDLSVGLPAELAARRKQYEYYRDKLLTFKELAA